MTKDGKGIDGLEVMGEVTGLGREEMVKIHEEVKANHAKLNACPGPHDFQPESDPPTRRVNRFRCTKCGGTVSLSDYKWYQDGLKHGRAMRRAADNETPEAHDLDVVETDAIESVDKS